MHNRRPHSVGTRRLAGAPRCALRCASGRAARPRVCGLERQRRERYGVDTGVQAGAGGTSKGRRLLRAERGPPVAPQAPLPSAPTRCSAQYHEQEPNSSHSSTSRRSSIVAPSSRLVLQPAQRYTLHVVLLPPRSIRVHSVACQPHVHLGTQRKARFTGGMGAACCGNLPRSHLYKIVVT